MYMREAIDPLQDLIGLVAVRLRVIPRRQPPFLSFLPFLSIEEEAQPQQQPQGNRERISLVNVWIYLS